eukprot:573749-Rhodomonas_salina.1
MPFELRVLEAILLTLITHFAEGVQQCLRDKQIISKGQSGPLRTTFLKMLIVQCKPPSAARVLCASLWRAWLRRECVSWRRCAPEQQHQQRDADQNVETEAAHDGHRGGHPGRRTRHRGGARGRGGHGAHVLIPIPDPSSPSTPSSSLPPLAPSSLRFLLLSPLSRLSRSFLAPFSLLPLLSSSPSTSSALSASLLSCDAASSPYP